MARLRDTGITQRSAEDGFSDPVPVTADHMSAFGCLGRRSAFHHRGFYAPGADGCPSNRWLEVWWTVDVHTGQVTDIFEDTRGLNRR